MLRNTCVYTVSLNLSLALAMRVEVGGRRALPTLLILSWPCWGHLPFYEPFFLKDIFIQKMSKMSHSSGSSQCSGNESPKTCSTR